MPKRPLALALLSGFVFAAPAAAAVCGAQPYWYAGLADGGRAHGVRATITAFTPLRVEPGHAAGWVGIDGHDRAGRPGWLQVGYVGFQGDDRRIYYEVKPPSGVARFVELESGVPLGEPHRVAVRAEAARPSRWRVWLEGRPVTAPIRLPGSEQGRRAVATAESWNAGTGSCNALHFQFGEVGVLPSTRRWRASAQTAVLEDPGYEVRDRTRTGLGAAPA